MRVSFTVATHYYVQKPDNTGYSWGILYHELEDGKFKVYIACPEERGRIAALQIIPLSIFDKASILDKFCIISKNDKIFDRCYFLVAPNHQYKVDIPDDFNIEANIELVSKYLRRTVCDSKEKVYTIPSVEEMENVVSKVKKVII